MRGLARLACAAVMVTGAACGDSVRPSKIVPQQAASTVTVLHQFRQTMTAGDGATVATVLPSIGTQASLIVQPDEQQQVRRPFPQPVVFAVGTCQCDEGGCTFNGCGDDQGTFTADGTISVSGDVYTFDVVWSKVTVNMTDEVRQSWTYTGSLTMTDTSMAGALSGEGAFDILEDGRDSIQVDYSWDLDVRDVQIDGSGCPTGGSMGVDGDIVETFAGHGFHWGASGTVRFESCGVATLE